MKYFIYNYWFVCFVLLIMIFIYFNTLQNIEEFTPTIRKMYRPYVRKARIIGEGFFIEHKMNISNFLRKFGIM